MSNPDKPKSLEERIIDLENAVFQQALMNKMLMQALSKSLHDHEALKAIIKQMDVEMHTSHVPESKRKEYNDWLETQGSDALGG